jgi:hypothetical protein
MARATVCSNVSDWIAFLQAHCAIDECGVPDAVDRIKPSDTNGTSISL